MLWNSSPVPPSSFFSPLSPQNTPPPLAKQPLFCPTSRSPGHSPDHKAHHTHSLHLFQLSVGNWPSSKARVLEEQVAPMFLARCSWAHWNWTAGRSAEHQGLRAQESGGSGREGRGFNLPTPHTLSLSCHPSTPPDLKTRHKTRKQVCKYYQRRAGTSQASGLNGLNSSHAWYRSKGWSWFLGLQDNCEFGQTGGFHVHPHQARPTWEGRDNIF